MKTFRRYLLSYLLTLFLPVGILSIVISQIVLHYCAAQLLDSNAAALHQLDTAVSMQVTQFNAYAVQTTQRTEFYRRKPDARAVAHTHSVFCTTFAVLGLPLRAVHYVIGDAHTDEIPCAPYETYGTPELARAAAQTCGAGRAVLLANHGLVACGGSMEEAYGLACNLEFVAELQYRAMCIGTPNVLSREQMAQVLEKFRTYGQPR